MELLSLDKYKTEIHKTLIARLDLGTLILVASTWLLCLWGKRALILL